jgi:Rad3-related DNA helicase
MRFDASKGRAALIKSAVEYECPIHRLCSHGAVRKCPHRKEGDCAYRLAKEVFVTSPLGVTNYAYFFTERAFVGELIARRVLCLDECHNLAKLITRFVDVTVNEKGLEKFANSELAPDLKRIETVAEFVAWLVRTYIPAVKEKVAIVNALADTHHDLPDAAKLAHEVAQHQQKVEAAVERLLEGAQDWIFWREDGRDGVELTARPLEAAPFFPQLVMSAGSLRIYLSAFPGDRRTFCRDLGLDPAAVAWLSLDSTFPVEHRPVYLTTVGSMSRANKEATTPALLRMVAKLLAKHAGERGVIHSHSYELADKVNEWLTWSPHARRLTYPRKADDRDEALKAHMAKPDSVLLSPSMAEGFDFKDDIARFQIILKCPYPSLGDKQVAAKLARNRRWYESETVKTILQACGRACRSETDHSSTYILDADAERLLREWHDDLPGWFTDSLVQFR